MGGQRLRPQRGPQTLTVTQWFPPEQRVANIMRRPFRRERRGSFQTPEIVEIPTAEIRTSGIAQIPTAGTRTAGIRRKASDRSLHHPRAETRTRTTAVQRTRDSV